MLERIKNQVIQGTAVRGAALGVSGGVVGWWGSVLRWRDLTIRRGVWLKPKMGIVEETWRGRRKVDLGLVATAAAATDKQSRKQKSCQ